MQSADDAKRLRLLYELACAFAAQTDIDTLIPFVVRQCRTVFDAGGASVLLLDRDAGELYFPYTAEADPAVAKRLLAARFPADHGIAGAVVQSGRGASRRRHAGGPTLLPGRRRAHRREYPQPLAAPLSSRGGIIGVLQVVNRRTGTFGEDDLAFLETLAASVAVALDNARASTPPSAPPRSACAPRSARFAATSRAPSSAPTSSASAPPWRRSFGSSRAPQRRRLPC